MPGLGAARIAWLGLIALQLLWFGWLAPAESLGRTGGLLFALLPLLLPLWPILRLNLDALVVGGMILLIYFCFAVVEAWVSPAVRVLALIEIALIALYYLALLSVRRRRGGKAAERPR